MLLIALIVPNFVIGLAVGMCTSAVREPDSITIVDGKRTMVHAGADSDALPRVLRQTVATEYPLSRIGVFVVFSIYVAGVGSQ